MVKGPLKIVTYIIVVCLCSSAFAGEWEQPWDSVKDAAAQRCAANFQDYQLQAVCMQNEREGYDKMQGDFGLPTDIAEKAKERCEATFKDFQLQAVCMENEREGYDKMKNY